MKKLVILSLLLLSTICNSVYSMDNYNNESDNSTDSTNYSTHIDDDFEDNFEIDFDDNGINQFANMENKELKEFERWSYEKLEELNKGNIICDCDTCNKNMKTIKDKLKKILSNLQLDQEFIEDYINFLNKYFEGVFYNENNIINTEGVNYSSNINSNMRRVFNKTDKNIMYKILCNNINKFIYHNCKYNKVKSEILSKYLYHNRYTLNVLYQMLLDALIINSNDYTNPKYNNYTNEQILFIKFKEYFEQHVQNSQYKQEFLNAIQYMITTKWITNINIIQYFAKQQKYKKSMCNIF